MIKKFNEYFDTEELKINNEIDLLSGKLNPKALVNIEDNVDTKTQLMDIIIYKYPFFELCLDPNNKYAGVGRYEFMDPDKAIAFYFKNETWMVQMVIQKLSNKKYNLIFIRKGVDLEITPTNVVQLGVPSLDYEEDKLYIETYDDLNIIEVWHHIEMSFIPTLKNTGFSAIINLKDSAYKIRSN